MTEPNATPAAVQVESALKCGHPAALLVRSVESDHAFCELCEARDRLRDALTMERSLSDQRDRFFRDMLVMLSGHRVPTPEKGYGSHGDGYGHIISDVDRALAALRATAAPSPTEEKS